ncbi:uncharacterized protein O3C94_019846 [Discoglossus pictus]
MASKIHLTDVLPMLQDSLSLLEKYAQHMETVENPQRFATKAVTLSSDSESTDVQPALQDSRAALNMAPSDQTTDVLPMVQGTIAVLYSTLEEMDKTENTTTPTSKVLYSTLDKEKSKDTTAQTSNAERMNPEIESTHIQPVMQSSREGEETNTRIHHTQPKTREANYTTIPHTEPDIDLELEEHLRKEKNQTYLIERLFRKYIVVSVISIVLLIAVLIMFCSCVMFQTVITTDQRPVKMTTVQHGYQKETRRPSGKGDKDFVHHEKGNVKTVSYYLPSDHSKCSSASPSKQPQSPRQNPQKSPRKTHRKTSRKNVLSSPQTSPARNPPRTHQTSPPRSPSTKYKTSSPRGHKSPPRSYQSIPQRSHQASSPKDINVLYLSPNLNTKSQQKQTSPKCPLCVVNEKPDLARTLFQYKSCNDISIDSDSS